MTTQAGRPTDSAPHVFHAKLVRTRSARGRIELGVALPDEPAQVPRVPARRPARVAQMLALAHGIERSIARGAYRDRADAAKQLGLTPARVSQLSDLLVLAPDIQEELLSLESVDGVEPITERALRPLLRLLAWSEQRWRWVTLRPRE